MCLLLLNIHNFLTLTHNLLSIESLAYRLITQPIMLCALFDKMTAQTVSDLESVIFTLPSLLCEMERHYLSDNIDMCGFFARRGEDFVGLLRVCASVLAQQNNLTVSLTREIQELISRLESNVFHFQARQDFLLEGDSRIASKLHLRNNAQMSCQATGSWPLCEFVIYP